VISNRVFYDNEAGSGGTHGGGGIFCNSSPATIISCTFVGNSGAPCAGGIHSYVSAVTARRCIIAFSPDGAGVYSVDADHCVIFGNAGEDIIIDPTSENLFIDPLLCDIETWNLMLCSNSPCLPGSPQNPWGELIGAYESGCDECEPSVQKSSWGSIKTKLGNQ
jgi:hypothetical protein